MWKAYYRRQPVRLAALLVRANRERAGVGSLRAVTAAFHLARAAAGFGRATGDDDRSCSSPALELARRRAAADPSILAAIAAPPGPRFPHNLLRCST